MTVSVLQERQTSAGSASVTSIALAFSSAVTASSSLETYATSGAAKTHTCSDSSNGSHTSLEQTTANAVGTYSHFNKDNSAAATITVTVSFTSDTFPSIWIREIGGTSGIDGTAHGLNNQGNGSGTTRTSPILTPSVQPGLISSLLYNDISPAGAAGAGFTASNPVSGWNFGGVTSNEAFAESKRYTSTSALSGSFTSINNTDTTVIGAALYKESASASNPFTPIDLDERVTTKVLASDFAPPNLLTNKTLNLPPFIQKELPSQAPRAPGVYTDFTAPNLLADQILKPPPFTQKELPGWAIQAKGNYTDFAPPNLLAEQTLKLPPFTQKEGPGVIVRARAIDDIPAPNLLNSTLRPIAAPLNPVDLSQQVRFRWSATDFNAPNLSFTLPVTVNPLVPKDLSVTVNARWVPDFIPANLLTNQTLKLPPLAPVDATITIRAKGVFTDFSPPNLALSTLVPLAPTTSQDISGIRLEYRWVRGDTFFPNLTLSTLAPAAAAPVLPQDISGIRLDVRGLPTDFVPPNLTLTLPVPPPVPASTAAGRHGTRRQARRRRQLDVLRAKLDAFKEQRIEADQALMRAEEGEIQVRAKLLKRVKVKPLTKPLEEYAPVKKAVAQRTVVMERHRSILEQIRAHQLEAERIQREIEDERDEEAALHLFHFLMMETSWYE